MKESAKEKSASGSAMNSFSSGTGGPVGGARAGRSRLSRMARVAAGGWTTESHRMRAPQRGHSSTSMAKTRRKSSAQPNRRNRTTEDELQADVHAQAPSTPLRRAMISSISEKVISPRNSEPSRLPKGCRGQRSSSTN